MISFPCKKPGFTTCIWFRHYFTVFIHRRLDIFAVSLRSTTIFLILTIHFLYLFCLWLGCCWFVICRLVCRVFRFEKTENRWDYITLVRYFYDIKHSGLVHCPWSVCCLFRIFYGTLLNCGVC